MGLAMLFMNMFDGIAWSPVEDGFPCLGSPERRGGSALPVTLH